MFTLESVYTNIRQIFYPLYVGENIQLARLHESNSEVNCNYGTRAMGTFHISNMKISAGDPSHTRTNVI